MDSFNVSADLNFVLLAENSKEVSLYIETFYCHNIRTISFMLLKISFKHVENLKQNFYRKLLTSESIY